MKLGLYVTPQDDVIFQRIDDRWYVLHKPVTDYVTPGQPCSQAYIETHDTRQLLTTSRSIAHVVYNIPDDVELYTE